MDSSETDIWGVLFNPIYIIKAIAVYYNIMDYKSSGGG